MSDTATKLESIGKGPAEKAISTLSSTPAIIQGRGRVVFHLLFGKAEDLILQVLKNWFQDWALPMNRMDALEATDLNEAEFDEALTILSADKLIEQKNDYLSLTAKGIYFFESGIARM